MILSLGSDLLHLVFAFCDALKEVNATAATCNRLHAEVFAFKAQKVQEKVAQIFGADKNPTDRQELLQWFNTLYTKRVMLVGGESNPRRSLIFQPKRETFVRRCAVGIKRTTDFDAIFHAGELIVLSGSDGPSVSSVESYDVLSNVWNELPSIPEALVAVAGITDRKHIYITGGQDRINRMRTKSVYVLLRDAARDQDKIALPRWALLSVQLRKGRSHHGGVLYGERIWIAGGLVEDSLQATDSVESVCMIRSETLIQAPMVRKRLRPRLLVINDALYAVGGDMNNFYHTASTIEKYDAVAQRWNMLSEFPTMRPGCAIAALGHRIYVFGGGGSQSLAQGSWDFFDTLTCTWESSKVGFNIPFLTYKDGFREWIKDSLAVTIDFETTKTNKTY